MVADSVDASELAELAETTPARIEELAQLRLLRPTDGRYARGDVHRVRLVNAFAAAGVPAEALARASEERTISLTYYDQLHPDPGTLSTGTFGQLVDALGEQASDLRHLFSAFGIAEPDADNRLTRDDERLLLTILETLRLNRDPDLALRALRILGDSARRGSEAAMSVYAEAVERGGSGLVGIPALELYEGFLQPWGRFARLVPELTAWLYGRHLSTAIDAWSVTETEQRLAEAGFVPPPKAAQPAVAFIDLTAFTQLTQERGDRLASEVATALADLARDSAERHGGRVVKQLGDGVLLRFADLGSGVAATLDVLEGLAAAGLPAGHAGIDAGPIILREGDVYGRTVNRASRIADRAEPGQLLAPAALAPNLPGDVGHRRAGTASLQGMAEPLALIHIWRDQLAE